MEFARVWSVFFSPGGATRRVGCEIAAVLAENFCATYTAHDFTRPGARGNWPVFAPDDLVVFGVPVYAGRVPNVLLKALELLQGNGAAMVPIVVFGNRDFDDALLELRDILARRGFCPVAAGAFVGEHSFSATLAAGRPDVQDMARAVEFAQKITEKLAVLPALSQAGRLAIPGVPAPYRGYYQPKNSAGQPVDFRHIKPEVAACCNQCGVCAAVCPTGAICAQDVRVYEGICIKCGACVKRCVQGARFYTQTDYLYHKRELETGFTRRAQPVVFL